MMPSIKRKLVNFILIDGFVFFSAIIVIPFLAEMEFSNAQKYVLDSRWEESDRAFQNSIRLDPFNAKYPYGFSEFLVSRSFAAKDRMSLLKKAEGLCVRALELNPVNSEYYIKLGQVELDIDKNNADDAFNNFKSALNNDPNGFGAAYAVGYACLTAWDRLNDNQREIFI